MKAAMAEVLAVISVSSDGGDVVEISPNGRCGRPLLCKNGNLRLIEVFQTLTFFHCDMYDETSIKRTPSGPSKVFA